MHLHEYQIKGIMRKYGISLLDGIVVNKESSNSNLSDKEKHEIESAIEEIISKSNVAVIKAQVHAGGRGKAGGVKVFVGQDKKEEAVKFASGLIGTKLVTHQTDANGQFVSGIFVESGCKIEKEFYFSMVVNRESNCVSMIVSEQGGMDIEEVAHNSPDAIHTIDINPVSGYQAFYAKLVAKIFGIEAKTKELNLMLSALYKLFIENDLSLLEINPLVLAQVDGAQKLVVLDGKATIDSNALFKHPEIKSMWDETQETPIEVRAHKANLSYVQLDGNIGCVVNGAGLAMATMDIIKYYGANPANFLDVGGGASKEGVKTAFEIILGDKNIKGLLVNIFGGIVRCDMIAQAVVDSVKELKKEGIAVPPIVVRLSGTNSDIGNKIIAESGLGMKPASDLDDAAKQIVSLI